MTRPQEHQRRVDRDLLAAAATKLRRELAKEQASEAPAPIVPYGQGTFVVLLDELSIGAGRGQVSDGVRRVAVELAGKILDEGTAKPRVIWVGFRP